MNHFFRIAVAGFLSMGLYASPARISSDEAKELVGKQAQEVVELLAAKDFHSLAPFVDPVKGVRFSPFAQVDTDADVVLHRNDLTSNGAVGQERKWGAYDGSGDPIRGTLAAYGRDFLYDRDFAHAKRIGYDQSFAKGNTKSNVGEAYPGCIYVEFYVDPQDKDKAQDWHALRLVFQQRGKDWFLVGIIHDQWTI